MCLYFCESKWSNLKLKTQPKQLLGSLLLAFAPPPPLGVSVIILVTKQPNLKWKTCPKQLLGYLSLVFALQAEN
jgi:hypothetical protein